MPTPTSELRWCEDIGLWALDRPKSSCTHRTAYCDAHCYNNKFWRWPSVVEKDARNEAFWERMDTDVHELVQALARKRKPTDRLRLMTRGEALATKHDLYRVEQIARALPDTLIWTPTRAWRKREWAPQLTQLRREPNLLLLASLDPSNTAEEHKALVEDGWSTMYFGPTPPPWDTFGCPKTLRPVPPGHCAGCKAGCFAPRVLGRRVDVYLKEH
jgi:hypothetical protein